VLPQLGPGNHPAKFPQGARHNFRLALTQPKMIKRLGRSRIAILVLGFLIGVPLCYVGVGLAAYYWKERVEHFEPGAVSSLEALHTIESNYKSGTGVYSVDFEELGIPWEV
jgi:hypothetical protein